MDLGTRKVEITAHNHGFAVDAPIDRPTQTPYGTAEVSHINLNDDVIEGLQLTDPDGRLLAFSVQYHPEAAAGPHDAGYLFDRFITLLRSSRLRRPKSEENAARSRPVGSDETSPAPSDVSADVSSDGFADGDDL
jgi:carbamoyl-phosphate synthase small subunit